MQLETAITKLIRFIQSRIEALSMSVTSGGVDNMENYKYIIGQINAYEATNRNSLTCLMIRSKMKEQSSILTQNPKIKYLSDINL